MRGRGKGRGKGGRGWPDQSQTRCYGSGCWFLRLGRYRQVWLIPIADERVGVQINVRTHAIPERFCDGASLLRGTISNVCTFTFTFFVVTFWLELCAALIAPVVTTASIILSSSDIPNGDILVPANPGPPGKWPLKRRERKTGPLALRTGPESLGESSNTDAPKRLPPHKVERYGLEWNVKRPD